MTAFAELCCYGRNRIENSEGRGLLKEDGTLDADILGAIASFFRMLVITDYVSCVDCRVESG